MFRIKILCVGNIKEKFFRDAFDEYLKRCSNFAKIEVVEIKEAIASKSIAEIVEGETSKLISLMSGFVFVLDEKGTLFNSKEFSSKIEKIGLSGNSEICFVIGGSNGLSEKIKKQSNQVISFGKMTFPHQLMRVILIEQIYRAFTIIQGSSYHK